MNQNYLPNIQTLCISMSVPPSGRPPLISLQQRWRQFPNLHIRAIVNFIGPNNGALSIRQSAVISTPAVGKQ